MLIGMLFIPALVTILVGLWLLIGTLREDWWQGIAGIAQILAGSLAAYTIIQARKVIQQADEERRLSVAPDWRADRYWSVAEDEDVAESKVRIELVNAGFGCAVDPHFSFTPDNNIVPGSVGGQVPHGLTIFPGKTMKINLNWYHDKPLDVTLVVTCTTRLGWEQSTRFHLKTARKARPDPNWPKRDDCQVWRLPDATKPHRRWPWQRERVT